MPKVYLSPAYHYWNPCAVAGCDETTHNNLYLDVLEPYLAACGIQYKRGPRRTPKSGEDGDALMLQAVRESDAWGADVHYVSHTNAANGDIIGKKNFHYGQQNHISSTAGSMEIFQCDLSSTSSVGASR